MGYHGYKQATAEKIAEGSIRVETGGIIVGKFYGIDQAMKSEVGITANRLNNKK